MNPITIGMDLLLAGLLVSALVMGARLNGRLKALKASHESFAQAVGELDAAARKADGALRELRKAGDETHDSLLARIETARSLSLKLEKASEVAEKAAAHAEEAARKPVMTLPQAPTPPGVTRRSISDLMAAQAAREAAIDMAPQSIDHLFDVPSQPPERPQPKVLHSTPSSHR